MLASLCIGPQHGWAEDAFFLSNPTKCCVCANLILFLLVLALVKNIKIIISPRLAIILFFFIVVLLGYNAFVHTCMKFIVLKASIH